jgi:hypothetical protein
MVLRFLLLTWALGCASLWAAPVKFDSIKVGTRTYLHVTVLGFNTTDLYFTYDRGITNVKLRDLEPALQQEFGYDAQAAYDAERQQAAQDASYSAAIASNIVDQAEKAARAARKAAGTSPDSLADPVSDLSLLGKPAPALEVEKWLGAKPSLDGKFVLITFWAPWSLPCRKCIPDWNSLQKTFTDRLAVVGITAEPETSVKELADPKIEFASAIDSQAKMGTAMGATSIPYVVLLDPKGIVRYQGHPSAITQEKLQSIIGPATQ